MRKPCGEAVRDVILSLGSKAGMAEADFRALLQQVFGG